MTVKEVIKITIDNLNDIQIPVPLIQQIGLPIAQQIDNLRECITAIERAEQEAVAKAEDAKDKQVEGPEKEQEEEGPEDV